MMSASTGFSICGTQTSAPVAVATGATAPTWSKCVCVRRIPSSSTPSSSIALRSFGASSPGSTISALSEPSRRNRKQFSITGPTVNMRTSMGWRLPLLLSLLLLLPPLVQQLVHVVAGRHVQEKGEQGERDRPGGRLPQDDHRDHGEEHRRDRGPVHGAPPRRRLVHAFLPPLRRGLAHL